MRKSKKVLLILLILIGVLAAFNLSLIQYGLMQAKGQFEVLWNAEPLEDYLQSPNFPDSLKAKITIIQEAKAFAEQELGLTPSDNYTKMYDQKGKDILWVVTAAEPFELKAYEWEFPFLGKVSYKGFFNYKKGQQLEQQLKNKGYDARLTPVNAWSTLGWFNDPILSSMLQRSEGRLAELIIHELTHGTLYVKDSVSFNENLASFIGQRGAELFLLDKYGKKANQALLQYQRDLFDRQLLSDTILQEATKLDSLYTQWKALPISQKNTKKVRALEEIKQKLRSLPFQETKNGAQLFTETELNNATFLSYMRYKGFKTELDSVWNAHNKNIRDMINAFKEQYPSL